MSCPSYELLAALASGEAPELETHVAECERCTHEIELQRELVAHVRGFAVPALSRPRRMALAAETLARADADRHRSARITLTAGFALAAGVAIVLALPSVHQRPPVTGPTPAPAPGPTCDEDVPAPAPVVTDVPVPPAPTPAPAPRPAALASSDGLLERTRLRGRDTITLHDGSLVVDARDRAPVSVVAGDITVAVADSRAKIVAVDNLAVSVHVIASAAELTEGSDHDKLAAGATWTPPATPATSLAMFRAGWKALREQHFGDAIAAFDLARDPVVAEDAAYWAANAASRAGRAREARTRYEAFLAAFPDSTRADAARAALGAGAPDGPTGPQD